jgi:nitroreductase
MNETLENIFKRRSVRDYLDQPVEKEKLELLLEAAMAAPNACNSQPWEFIVVTDADILSRMRNKLHAGRYNAPAAIVVCGNLDIANNSAARYFWVQDCSAATSNILLAATSLDLGAVWIGVYPLPGLPQPVAEILNLPTHVTPLNIIYVGYPAEIPTSRTQFDQHRVYWQQYEKRKPKKKIKNAKYL